MALWWSRRSSGRSWPADAALATRARPWERVLLRWLGERSFSIYLVHLPLLSGLRMALLDLAPVGVVAALAALGAVLAALCLEGLVTRPSMLAGRRVAARICESKGAKPPLRVEVSNG